MTALGLRRVLAVGAALAILGLPLLVFLHQLRCSPAFYLGDGFPPGQAAYVMMRPVGHLAFCLAFLQILLGSGHRPLAAWLGFDTLLPLHQALGLSTVGMAALHPLLFAWAQFLRTGKSHFQNTFLPRPMAPGYWPWYFFFGALALYGLILGALAATAGRRWLPGAWRVLHGVVYLAFGAAWYHSLATGNEVREQPLAVAYTLMAAVVALLLFRRLLGRLPVVAPRLDGRSLPIRVAVGTGTLLMGAVLIAPAFRETWGSASHQESWRKDFYVVRPADVARMMAQDSQRILFVDTREAEEYADYHIPHARRVPVREAQAVDLAEYLTADLVIPYCVKDLRGFEMARLLQKRGVPHVALLEGFGISSWERAGLPVAGTYSGLGDEDAMRRLRVMVLGEDPPEGR